MNVPAAPLVQTFLTHRMTDETIRTLATGREQEIGRIMDAVRRSLGAAPGALQHVAIYGPRGFGKSFVARLAQIETADLVAARGVPIPFVLLPEEQHNLTRNPHALPAYIAHKVADLRTGEDRSWAGAMFQWPDPEKEARQWDEAVDQLERELDLSLPAGRGMAVVVIENFDVLLASVFKEDVAEQRLRKWLDRPRNRIMLIATATGSVDMDYERPLFQAFQSIRLEPWSQDTCILYFNRRREAEALAPLDAAAEAKARAVADFIGGNPRLAQLLADVLETQDALSVAATMNALADKLADYYRRRIDDLPALAQGLFDALIRGGEPASQTELAQRVDAGGQSTIARVMQDLQRADIIRGLPALDGRETLYRVTDRVFAHFYRLRQGQQLALQTPLATILDFLRAFYSRDEQRAQAMRHLNAGRPAEARLFAELAGDVGEQVEALCLAAWSLSELGRHEEALATALESFALARSVSDIFNIRLGATGAIRAAAHVPSPEAIDAFAIWVAEDEKTPQDEKEPDWRRWLKELFAAATRARAWETLDKLLETYSDRLPSGYFFWPAVGAAIARTAAAEDRAAGFEAARGVLPRVVRLYGLLKNPDLSPSSALSDIVSAFARDCRNSGLIRDVAGLLSPELDPKAPQQASLLRALAQVDEASKPEAVLVRMDPDIALWVRRIRDLPEPDEAPRRRRTRNG
ncbi:MAG: ATP-binding protein [Candidatus Contendobacter sp.]|nr:ATP-binding protein [Candidatus Contendobacter sp.]MDG4557984.1 ATP-binding protein [Candidatus Contendobacter sp.]